jgi:hypothetical protein
MARKQNLDMSGLLATKGEGAPSNDAPVRPVSTNEQKVKKTNKQIDEIKTPSSEFVNLGFKVPKEFRHRLRKIAAHNDISLVEVLKVAIDLYEQKHVH